jgi:hypothetical protein
MAVGVVIPETVDAPDELEPRVADVSDASERLIRSGGVTRLWSLE